MKRPAGTDGVPTGATLRRPSGRPVRSFGVGVRALALALTLAPVAARAQASPQESAEPTELDRVLAMNHEARGGLEALRAIQDARATGTMTVQGMAAPVTVLQARPNLVRMEADFGGMALIQAFDGAQAWVQQPGLPKPVVAEGPGAAAQAADAALNSLWFEYGQPGYEVELAGVEDTEAGEAWKLLVTEPGGVTHQVFIGTESGLEVKRVGRADVGSGVEDVTTLYDDYREVDGLMLAHRQVLLTSMGEMPMTLDSIEINPELDRDVFFMPGQTADALLGLDAIVDRHLWARGAFAADVQTIRGDGVVVMLGFEVPMRLAFARPDAFRIDIDLQGMAMVLAHDGETAWSVSPLQGIIEPTPLPEDMSGAVSILSSFLWGPLGDAAERGLDVTLAGIEKVERDETYRLDVVAASGTDRSVHLGGEDFLERRIVFDGAFLGSAGVLNVELGDYAEHDGLVVPGTVRIAVEGQVMAELRIANVEVNADIDAAAFAMPSVAADEAPEAADPQP